MAANNRHANAIFSPHCFNIIFNAIPRFRLVAAPASVILAVAAVVKLSAARSSFVRHKNTLKLKSILSKHSDLYKSVLD